ncbi:MAG: hypothetical protein H0U89_09190 [Acidimicrobiia bacterium]|nr:hypothetical protein [Acidimicrobiia bacterium]
MADRRRIVLLRVLLGGLAVASATIGAWAQALPRSFYDDFPGFGRVWVALDGPYNEHLVRDVGGLNLALALLLAAAAVTVGPVLVRVAAGSALLYGAPHLVYHLAHLDLYDTADQVGNAVALGLGVVAPLAVLLLARPSAPILDGKRRWC